MNNNSEDIWINAKERLRNDIPEHDLKAWINPLKYVESEDSDESLTLKLIAPNSFSEEWVNNNFYKKIEECVTKFANKKCSIVIKAKEESYSDPSSTLFSKEPVIQEVNNNKKLIAIKNGKSSISIINPSYSFDNFVLSKSNELAYSYAHAISQNNSSYNVIVIYSSPGLGKTHLLHAIANKVMEKSPESKVVYLCAEAFVNETIESIKNKKMHQFRRKYRKCDVLLVDDIQFLSGRKKTEEEFFHTFNDLHATKKKIIITCDKSPKRLDLEEKLITRLNWGLVAEIKPPDINARMSILKLKAEKGDIYLTDEISHLLSSNIKNNIRDLEGALIRIATQASLTGSEISIDMVKQELNEEVRPIKESLVSVEKIQSVVANYFNISVSNLTNPKRTNEVTLPRQIAIYFIRRKLGVRFREIGKYFGGKNHSTILHACKKVESKISTDPYIQKSIKVIQSRL